MPRLRQVPKADAHPQARAIEGGSHVMGMVDAGRPPRAREE